MPTVKEESFSLGGVDSRSNPTNFPKDRSIRCLNFAPQESGALRLRPGYTVPAGSPNLGSPIHSALYYEQFSAAYLGPQYVMYGSGTGIYSFNIAAPSNALIGNFSTINPWGHCRSGNRIFISDGVTNYNWDGTTLRVTGITGLLSLPVAPTSEYAGTAAGVWTSPSNAVGPPDNLYAEGLTSGLLNGITASLFLYNFGFNIPLTASIVGIVINVTGFVHDLIGPGGNYSLTASLWNFITGSYGDYRTAIYVGDASPSSPPMGGSMDTWGVGTGLTPVVLNSPDFGINLFGGQIPGSSSAVNWNIDAAQITVYYTGASGAVVSVTSSSFGSIAPTSLSGYQLYAAIYDPITQHMGNCAPIGNPVTVGATNSAFLVSGLDLLTPINSEWEYALGMTNDGGQVPYWFVDSYGNNIVLGNSATMGTVYLGNVNALQELPFRNDVPPPFDKYAQVGTRLFAGLAGNPFMSYSNDPSDISNANYVGQPAESWPADQQEPLPDGLLPTALHAYRLEGWFFSRENLHIWSQFLLQQGVNPWRGPWPGGCAGQRAFVETPHGPFWISAQKQLCTFMEDGVISVSEEYELSLLGQIADATLGQTEVAYLLGQTELIDQIVIKGLDVNGNPVIVVHDFNLEDERSPHGQGYQYQYTGLAVQTFVGAGYTPRQNVYDLNAKMRLWAGSVAGTFAQLEDGIQDDGADYSGDYIGLLGMGTQRRSLLELEYQGDPNLVVSYLPDYTLGLGDFILAPQDPIPENIVQNGTRFAAKFGSEEARFVYIRLQLTSSATGTFAVTNPPFLPMPSYGAINETVLKLGAPRAEGR